MLSEFFFLEFSWDFCACVEPDIVSSIPFFCTRFRFLLRSQQGPDFDPEVQAHSSRWIGCTDNFGMICTYNLFVTMDEGILNLWETLSSRAALLNHVFPMFPCGTYEALFLSRIWMDCSYPLGEHYLPFFCYFM